jgi:putative ABC transport system permease protein
VLAESEDEILVYAVRSLPEDTSKSNSNYLSRLTLSDGRMPDASNECVIDSRMNDKNGSIHVIRVGDKISLDADNKEDTLGMFAEREYTVVGLGYSPNYITLEHGNTDIGTGVVDSFMYLPESAFDSEFYTELDIRIKATDGLSPFVGKYEDAVKDGTQQLEDWTDVRADVRYDEFQAEADAVEAELKAQIEKLALHDPVAAQKLQKEAEAQADSVSFHVPEWYIFDRADNPGYSGFEDTANRINSISLTLTSFLFLVAALVCLTTMTRMVEEQRLQLGTFKAIGYGRDAVMFKYLFYAFAVSFAGGLLGSAIGFAVLPKIIWNAYTMLYTMDDLKINVTPWAAAIGIGGGLLATVAATVAAIWNDMRISTADLMRPKAPKAGKRVLLERVSPIWKRLSFSYKVTARNLFRNKKRFVMTIIGVAGCSALLLTGFGIRDSIGSMVNLQFGEITHSQITVYIDEPSSHEADTPINKLLTKDGKFAYYQEQDVKVSHGKLNNTGMPTEVFVPEDMNTLGSFIDLRERKSGDKVAFPPVKSENIPGGIPVAVVTEKLANELDVSEGDVIMVGFPGAKKHEIGVSGICENYLYNYIYMTHEGYELAFGNAPEYSSILLNLAAGSDAADAAVEGDYTKELEEIVGTEGVRSAISVTQLRSIMDDVVTSLNAIVYVVLAIAGLLALIVLYNLSNINITERERELATLRVLGFNKKEISAYVSRESIILTVISILIGLFAGYFLHMYVMRSVEVSEFMFGREIHPLSYLWTGLFTFACAIIINVAMLPKIMRIDPASSLKSAE